MNPPSSPTRVQYYMEGSTSSVERVPVEFLTPIIPKIGGETTREELIDLHQLVGGNAASVALNLGGDHNRHLMLMMNAEEYKTHTGFVFVPPNNPGDYPQSM